MFLHGRTHTAESRVWRKVTTPSLNSLAVQDLIGVCHIQTYVNKKVYRHMNLLPHIRNTVKSPDKKNHVVGFFTPPVRWEFFAHCESHIGFGSVWNIRVSVGGSVWNIRVSVGGSDQMLYEHITVWTPDVTDSWSCLPSYYLSYTSRHCVVSVVMVSRWLWVWLSTFTTFQNFQ